MWQGSLKGCGSDAYAAKAARTVRTSRGEWIVQEVRRGYHQRVEAMVLEQEGALHERRVMVVVDGVIVAVEAVRAPRGVPIEE